MALLQDRGAWSTADEILVDQGGADNFLVGDIDQLLPSNLEAACEAAGQPLRLRVHDGRRLRSEEVPALRR